MWSVFGVERMDSFGPTGHLREDCTTSFNTNLRFTDLIWSFDGYLETNCYQLGVCHKYHILIIGL